MSGFDVSAVEALDFDFTGIPRGDKDPESGLPREGMCTGKGVVPEPSVERLEAFQKEMVELGGLSKAAMGGDADALAKLNEAGMDRVLSALAALCDGAPTRAELAQLPPRYLAAFSLWLQGQVAPKV